MKKNSFVFHLKDKNLLQRLTDAETGQIFKAIISYTETGSEPMFEDRALAVAWDSIKDQLDYDAGKYADICAKRKEAINKRWANTKEYKCIQPYTNDTDTDSDSDSDSDTDSVSDKYKRQKRGKFSNFSQHEYDFDELRKRAKA